MLISLLHSVLVQQIHSRTFACNYITIKTLKNIPYTHTCRKTGEYNVRFILMAHQSIGLHQLLPSLNALLLSQRGSEVVDRFFKIYSICVDMSIKILKNKTFVSLHEIFFYTIRSWWWKIYLIKYIVVGKNSAFFMFQSLVVAFNFARKMRCSFC